MVPHNQNMGKSQHSKMHSFLGIVCSTLLLSTKALAQEDQYDPRSTNCGFRNTGMTIVDKTLYIDAGSWTDSYWWNGNQTKLLLEANYTRWQNEFLWKLDLSKGFDSEKPGWEVEGKPLSHDEHYNGVDGSLWNTGDGSFLTVGGTFDVRHGPAPGALYERLYDPVAKIYKTEPRMYKYNTGNKTWSQAGDLAQFRVERMYAAASAITLKPKRLAFNVGGLMVDKTDIVANATTQSWADGNKMRIYYVDEQRWETQTLPSTMAWIAYSELHSLDAVGTSGVLVLLAGFRKTDLTTNTGSYRDNKDIWVYDIESSQWYSQVAIGEIPRGRWASCSILVPAPDESSYQIYLFSGSDDTMFLDLYVLSIPAFIWTKIPLKNYPNEWGVRYHSCVAHQNRQMLISNGEYNASTRALPSRTQSERPCVLGNPVKVFDLVKWEFLDTFDPALTENLVPPTIVSIVGGSSKGNATVSKPRGGFERIALGEAFAKRNNRADGGDGLNNGGEPGGNHNGTSPGGPNEDKKKAPVAAIAGGVVGGLAVLALIAGVFLWRRRQNNAAGAAATEHATPAQNYAAGYVPGYPADPTASPYQYNSYNPYGTYPGGGQQQFLAEVPGGPGVGPGGMGGAGYYSEEYKPTPAVEIGTTAAYTPPVEMASPPFNGYTQGQGQGLAPPDVTPLNHTGGSPQSPHQKPEDHIS
ncbi:hypothetical protein DFH27DRAFT_363842 [Peziza echinospora]|nr:hypothetical protein DFH27DRAFT_363842 [Peziza echinospora]